jgi:thiol-disulfide isomerase/thioredoxin
MNAVIKFTCAIILLLPGVQCTDKKSVTERPPEGMVSLKGAKGSTVLVNQTDEILKIKGTFFSYLTNAEKNFECELGPGESDTLTFSFHYPDFVQFDAPKFRILAGPDKTVVCSFRRITSNLDDNLIDFEGDFKSINDYYYAHLKTYKTLDQESAPFYQVGDRITDFTRFGELADSITSQLITHLKKNSTGLPEWFITQEIWRLNYNSGFRKYNVLFAKEFYQGKKIVVGPEYFTFENTHPIVNSEAILSTAFLSYAMFYLHKHSAEITKPQGDAMLTLIDSLTNDHPVGDVLRLRRMLDLYRESKIKYSQLYWSATFANHENRLALDSLIGVNYNLPAIGQPCPQLPLETHSGSLTNLDQYKGRIIIVNFWATWCGPCIKEFPYENKLHEKYKPRISIVNVCIQSNRETWKSVVNERDSKTDNFYLNDDNYPLVRTAFDINELPRSILLDENLRVLDNHFPRASNLRSQHIENLLSSVGGKQ